MTSQELRQADYDKGRRYGNGSGQPGGFGGTGGFGGSNFPGQASTGFGGTASSNPFGSTSSSTTPFGGTSTSGFGGGAGFLNQNKPQAGGLFGGQSSSTTSGGLFGTAAPSTGTGFGGTGGSSIPFGTSSTQTKPSLFGGASGGLGGSTTGGGLFGNSGSTGFGATQQTQSSNPFGTFGTQNQQGQQGQDQNKPGGLFGGGGFGTTQTSQSQPSGGLFGGAQTVSGTGGLFGGTTSGQGSTGFGGTGQTTGGGLFGGFGTQQSKPSLFGGTGGFGGSQNQSSAGLFGGAANTSQQGGGLFGGASTNTSGGLFSNTQQQQKPSLFGTTQPNTTPQNNSLFGGGSTSGLFNTPQPSQQGPPQYQPLHSSLLDGNPYGQSSIWSGLPEATPQNSGPLVTPLSAGQRLKESQMRAIPSFRLSSSKLMTPPRRLGYGFTYSTYGTPNSAASTPGGSGLSSSMYGRSFTGGSFGRSVGKSFSASNLRQQFAADGESVLSPGAFAPGSSRYSSGSIRRLTIDRNLKTDLFSRPAQTQPSQPAPSSSTNGVTNGATNVETSNGTGPSEQPNKFKKRVSFDKDTTGGTQDGSLNGINGALVRTENDGPEPTAEEQGFLRSSRRGKSTNGNASAPPQMEEVRGNELAVVPEDRETDNTVSKLRLPTDAPAVVDPKPGEYWMKPSRAELSRMPRDRLQHFKGFQVGRHGCGFVTFEDEVDLTTVPLDDLFGKIIEIRIRSISVYSEASTKPPRGKGLNVLSTLHLENSWPRARGAPSSATSGPLFEKHINRLNKMPNTQYVSYDTQTGVWTFQVAHYTRYGLDYDAEEEEESGDGSDGSGLSDPPDHIVETDPTPRAENEVDSVMDVDGYTPEDSSPEEDTFDFKRKSVPGGFGRQSAIDYNQDELLLDDRAAGAVSGSDKSYESDQQESGDEMNMAGSFPQPEHPTAAMETPGKSAMKASQHRWGTPGGPLIDLGGDWAEQLQRTISPRKQNREALREVQGKVLIDRVSLPTKQKTVNDKNEIRTNIDLMNSLFGQHEERMALGRRKDEGGYGIEV
jgi:nuclear pore complex protein Nup98-Nup96